MGPLILGLDLGVGKGKARDEVKRKRKKTAAIWGRRRNMIVSFLAGGGWRG